jgi:hypothetical protein
MPFKGKLEFVCEVRIFFAMGVPLDQLQGQSRVFEQLNG